MRNVLRGEASENLILTGSTARSRGWGTPIIKFMDVIEKVIPGGLSAGEMLQMSRSLTSPVTGHHGKVRKQRFLML